MISIIYNTDLDSFRALWQRCLTDNRADDRSDDLYHRLVRAYSQPHRVYHTLTHIQSCFDIFRDVVTEVKNPDALALAIWFHDAIYDMEACDNEQRSADWFLEESENIFPDALRELVYNHIMATLHCGKEIKHHDSRIMVDIDLFSFGKPWPEFLQDSRNVRAEKSDISDEEFYRKQCGFQKTLLDQPRFFQSDYFFARYESRARQNLTDFLSIAEQKLSAKDE